MTPAKAGQRAQEGLPRPRGRHATYVIVDEVQQVRDRERAVASLQNRERTRVVVSFAMDDVRSLVSSKRSALLAPPDATRDPTS